MKIKAVEYIRVWATQRNKKIPTYRQVHVFTSRSINILMIMQGHYPIDILNITKNMLEIEIFDEKCTKGL